MEMLKEEKIFFRMKYDKKRHGQPDRPPPSTFTGISKYGTQNKIAGLGFYSRFYMYITIAISNGYWPLRTGSYMYMIYCCLC